MNRLLPDGDVPAREVLPRLLRAAREHLRMEVAFISEFVDGDRVFRHVDAASSGAPVRVGGSDPLEESYCARVVDGRLPQLMVDAGRVPEAAALPATAALPVGGHISVPLVLSDGRVYGTFCCFRADADESLNQRDLEIVRMFADVATAYVEADVSERHRRAAVEERIAAAIEVDGSLRTVFQPVIGLRDGALLGVEALSRFDVRPYRAPDVWFAEAASIGVGARLEQAAVRSAVRGLSLLPESAFLAVNVSPEAVMAGVLDDVVARVDVSRLVLEMTEHAAVADYELLEAALRPLRRRGALLAVDDAGAGYASFRHILRLRPEWIKMDASITRGIDDDPARLALADAMVGFAGRIGSSIIAEGVETPGELRVLESLGVTAAQGYHLARPGEMTDVMASSRCTQKERCTQGR
ncbi:MAG: EAL domain-containing protein [Actinobacteria bacterium]|nr:EAL domain-containing protein [Actinomycetota bacterium]